MRTLEFETTMENGAIVIPEHLANEKPSHIKVVYHYDPHSNKKEKQPSKKSDMILPPFIDTKGWKFCREEANARR